MKPEYTYYGKIIRVIDGDTLVVDLDLGFNIFKIEESVRLFGIDAPEIRTTDLAEKARGQDAKAFIESLVAKVENEDYNCICQTVKPKDKYGRYLANVLIKDINGVYSINLVETLIAEGHVK